MPFVRYTGRPRAQDAPYKAALDDAQRIVLDPWSNADGNIANHFVLDRHRATVPLRAHARDLFDLAALVYVADELVPRGSTADQWTREFAFHVPVAQLGSWQGAEQLLAQCLGFLSGDAYAFTWSERANVVPKRTVHRHRLRAGYDAVCLFSGGVDSLLGAASLLAAGRRVLLVGHYADGVTSSAQRDLFALLNRKHQGRASLLQVHVARSRRRHRRFRLPNKAEITHRSRSFLFLCAGAVVAVATGTNDLFIPENGLIALNAPLGASRRGTLSTRTAHPRYIEHFNLLLAALGFAARVANPFAHQSKTDMVLAVNDDAIRAALLRSVSCAHAGDLWREGKAGITHCGCCVPCLYRRTAFLAAGINEMDYLHDVFTALPTMTAHRARDIRMLVRFAATMERAHAIDLVATVLLHGGFNGGLNGEEYIARAEMLRRWAASFMDIVRQRSNRETRQVLGL